MGKQGNTNKDLVGKEVRANLIMSGHCCSGAKNILNVIANNCNIIIFCQKFTLKHGFSKNFPEFFRFGFLVFFFTPFILIQYPSCEFSQNR